MGCVYNFLGMGFELGRTRIASHVRKDGWVTWIAECGAVAPPRKDGGTYNVNCRSPLAKTEGLDYRLLFFVCKDGWSYFTSRSVFARREEVRRPTWQSTF
jgi:hypothetical protein